MDKKSKWIVGLLSALLIAGCTTFKLEKKYMIEQGNISRVEGTQPTTAQLPPVNIMYLRVDAEVDSATSVDQTARLQSELVAALEGSTSGLTKDGVTDLTTLFNKYINSKKDVVEQNDSGVPVEPTVPAVEPTVPAVEPTVMTRFDHTSWASTDGGKSLVLCLGDDTLYDKCYVGDTIIPLKEGFDEGRITYWNQTEEPEGNIICELDGKLYEFPSTKVQDKGSCP